MKKYIILIFILLILFLTYKLFFESTIKNTFPFSDADEVELLYYKQSHYGGALITDYKKTTFKKKIKLNAQEKEAVFDILFKENCYLNSMAACYDPRHSFLFTKGKDTLGFIEICLECSRIEVSSGIKELNMCDDRYFKLEKFFKERE